MGIYNYVDFEVNCTECGTLIKNFQTKDGESSFNIVKFNEVNNFHSICPNCGSFIEFYYAPENKERSIEDYKVRIIKFGKNGK